MNDTVSAIDYLLSTPGHRVPASVVVESFAIMERRTSTRHRSFLQGRIFFNNRRSSVDCLVRDISETGAKLVFSEAIAIPEAVELHIPNKAETFRVKLQWRSGDEVGVAFEREEPSPPLAPSVPASATPGDLLDRISKLESEVETLQRKFSELQHQLQAKSGSGN